VELQGYRSRRTRCGLLELAKLLLSVDIIQLSISTVSYTDFQAGYHQMFGFIKAGSGYLVPTKAGCRLNIFHNTESCHQISSAGGRIPIICTCKFG